MSVIFFYQKVPTSLLDIVKNLNHLKNLSLEELKQLADEIQMELMYIMSNLQRPDRASPGVVELTLAMHHAFHAPMDKILWDVAEQGMAVARDLEGKKERVVAVISNGTTMAGQAYEAMSNAGYLDPNMVVILNDSRHSLQPKPEEGSKRSVNALSSTLSKLQSSKSFRKLRELAKILPAQYFFYILIS